MEDDSGDVIKLNADERLAQQYSSAPDTEVGRAAGWELVSRHLDELRTFASTFSLLEDDAYDVAIQASEKALKKLREGKFKSRGSGRYRNWLLKLTKNMILDQLRVEGREEPLALDDDDIGERDSTWSSPNQLKRIVPGTPEEQMLTDTPEKQLLQAEEHIRVELLLNDQRRNLKPEEKEVLNYTRDGERPRHIERITGTSSAQASRLLYRARKKITRDFPTPQQLLQALDEICTRGIMNCG